MILRKCQYIKIVYPPPSVFLLTEGWKSRNDTGRPACLCQGSFKVFKEPGLGEPFGKASLANTAFGLGRYISMRDRSCWIG
jgi:hypothetical protein